MLEDYFEDFVLLQSHYLPDPDGGMVCQETAEIPFRAALCGVLGTEGEQAGQTFAHTAPCLLHPRSFPLRMGAMVRRQKSGALYQTITASENMEAPLAATLSMAQTRLERVVDAGCP